MSEALKSLEGLLSVKVTRAVVSVSLETLIDAVGETVSTNVVRMLSVLLSDPAASR